MTGSRTSIAMATYNGSAFITEQLMSLANQTRLPDQLVVCDDGSHDDTLERVEEFRRRAPFEVSVSQNTQNLGTTGNFERAIRLCEGDLIFLADQDDVWSPEKINILAGQLDRDPECGIVFCNGGVVDAQGEALGYDLWKALFFNAKEQSEVRQGRAPYVFLKHVVAAGNTLAFRAHYRDLLLPFPDLPSVHDAWIAFLVSSLSGCKIVPEKLIDYRLHGHNLIGIHRAHWLDQLRQARRQLKEDAFGRAHQFFQLAESRLSGKIDPELHVAIREKIAHSQTRSEMHPRLWNRFPDIYREWSTSRYTKYSYGVKSLAQDLWLR